MANPSVRVIFSTMLENWVEFFKFFSANTFFCSFFYWMKYMISIRISEAWLKTKLFQSHHLTYLCHIMVNTKIIISNPTKSFLLKNDLTELDQLSISKENKINCGPVWTLVFCVWRLCQDFKDYVFMTILLFYNIFNLDISWRACRTYPQKPRNHQKE